jgi:Zn-dependent protease with chaperone function
MTINCPHCGQATELSLPPADLEIEQQTGPSAVEILAAFGGPIPRTSVSLLYRFSLVLVAAMMLLLPLVYVAMVLAAAYGVYFYATHFYFLLQSLSGGPRFYILKALAYVIPLFAGTVLVLFMIKPLFARRASRAQPLALNPAVDKRVFAFIAKICDLVGAPMPKRIDLDCQVNAAAGFRRGALSLFNNDLVLTIGLPLVAGLDLRQFAGVVAHEFGHFTQGFSMRLSYMIRSINAWFARVAYDRDAWDVWLERWAEEEHDGRVAILIWCTQLAIGFSRLILKLLMLLGHGVSCFLLRQMEYDADSYEIKVAGSAAFEATVRRLRVLEAGLKNAYKEMRMTWNLSRRLPDNFPAYLVHHEAQLLAPLRQKIDDSLGLVKTGLFDTHPSDGDRIRCARQADDPGIFHLDLPASVLFVNFEVVSKQITHLHYADDLQIPVDAAMLRPVREGSRAVA